MTTVPLRGTTVWTPDGPGVFLGLTGNGALWRVELTHAQTVVRAYKPEDVSL